MKCPKCDAEIKEGSKFCRYCGAKVGAAAPARAKLFCPECGAECEPDDVFCAECGASLAEEEADVFASLDAAIDADYQKQAFEPFEYEDNRDGTYTVTGLKDKNIRRLAVPEGVVEITAGAFEGGKFTVVSLPQSLASIGDNAFKDCKEMREINLPEGLESLGTNAFCGCEKLQEVSIPHSLKEIQSSTFYQCLKLNKVELHDGIKSIGTYAFYECEALEKVHIPAKLKVLSSNVFEGCYSLKEIKLPEGLVSVDWYAFRRCSQVKRVVIPTSVTSIGYNAFANVNNAEFRYQGTMAQWKRISLDNRWNGWWYKGSVHCKDGTIVIQDK